MSELEPQRVARPESGMATLQYVVATACSLVIFVMLVNVVVDLYARGAVRAAIDEAARAGAPIDASASECAARARDVLLHLVGRRIRSGVSITCNERDDAMTARADVRLPSWLGVIPDWSFTLTGSAVKERDR
ncbi:MAG: hypothetical protein ABWY80_07270 [Acidimicrobiia bacterium]